MTEDENHGTSSPLERTFAVMLAELEDAATELTQRHDELAKEMQAVDAELERIEAVRAAMVGGPVRKRAKSKRQTGESPAGGIAKNGDRVLALLRERGEPVSSHDIADALGLNVNGIGPLMGGLVRAGSVTRSGEAGQREYALAAS